MIGSPAISCTHYGIQAFGCGLPIQKIQSLKPLRKHCHQRVKKAEAALFHKLSIPSSTVPFDSEAQGYEYDA